MKGILRELDQEAIDARISATTATLCVDVFLNRKLPVGEQGADVVALSEDETELLTHHAHRAEDSIRRVAGALGEAGRAAKSLPQPNIIIFDPIVGAIERYRIARSCMMLPDTSDEDAETLHREAMQPFSGDEPPIVLSSKGAIEALNLVMSWKDLDPVDANIVRGVVRFLEGRA
ncbi:hypothetical protein D3218_19125 [Aureimonas flava]|uniref:Uncharacterized protein n=1 Tax=Aureimonas flava TaxID=2320271 RepID=A0A3A1WE60_9HYPH|nr:hypothetical protein [Aureimonas flava]RIX97174.1 hypothetical protein D3218_19125 [Aureimonas flava]